MTNKEFKLRLLRSVDDVIKFTKRIIIEDIPLKSFKFNLYRSDYKEKYLRVGLNEILDILYKNGRIPKWIDIGIAKIDNGTTIFYCKYSDNLTNDDTMIQFPHDPHSPFQISGPIASKPYSSAEKKIHLEEFNEENWSLQ